MAEESLLVLLEGRVIGELDRLSAGELRLRYLAEHRDDPLATPLSVSMPSGETVHGDTRVSPWLWGLLPDNADVLNRWGRDFSVSVSSPYALLGTQVGNDCAGAVQFCSAKDVDALLSRTGEIFPLSNDDVGARLRTLRSDSTSWLGPGFTGQFSLAGAQAKTALHLSDGQWSLPTGSTPTTHILKPAIASFEWHELNEHLCLGAAAAVGLSAAASSIQTFGDQSAVVVERFDRREVDGVVQRIHQEDLCQALSVSPARKYQSEGGPTPGDIGSLMRSTMVADKAEADVWRFLDALAFNWLIAGTDAHAKNYGILLSGTQIRLAPLYDIASLLPYDESDGYDIRLAMKVGSDYKLRRTDRTSAWEAAADELRLDRVLVCERVIDLAKRIPDAFVQMSLSPTVAALDTDFADRLAERVIARSEHCVVALS